MGGDRVWKWSKMVEFPTFMGSWPWPWIRAWSLPFSSLIEYYLYAKFHRNRRNFLWTDGRNLPTIVLGRLPKFGSRPKNELVQHLLRIWFVTSGCLRDASRTFLALLYSWIVVALKNYSLFSSRGVAGWGVKSRIDIFQICIIRWRTMFIKSCFVVRLD